MIHPRLGERVKLLQEERTALVNEQSNRILFTLTLVTVLALPANLIAGLLGMNVGGIPLSGSPHGCSGDGSGSGSLLNAVRGPLAVGRIGLS